VSACAVGDLPSRPRSRVITLAVLAASLPLLACGSPVPSPVPPKPAAPQVAPRITAALPCSGAEGSKVETIRRTSKTQFVRASARVVASEDEAPSRARARAEAKALRAAVEAVGGVRVKSTLLAFDQLQGTNSGTLIQELITTGSNALVLDKRIVTQQAPAGGLGGAGYCYGVVIEAEVLDRSTNSDPGFEVEVELDRERFMSGDSVQVRIVSSRDARIYLMGIYEGGLVDLLPNSFRKSTLVRAGEPLLFPDTARGEAQDLLQAQIPKGKRAITETLLAIAIRGEGRLYPPRPSRRGRTFETAEATGAGVLLEGRLRPLLTSLTFDQWAFGHVAYEILAP
jgi:hypothetical protein